VAKFCSWCWTPGCKFVLDYMLGNFNPLPRDAAAED
jgi:hypothetical protein